jgi:hypothetical protein
VAFFGRFWPEARAVSDLSKRFYTAFGLHKGSVRALFGPSVWASGLRAACKGNGVGRPVGDPWIMPGVFLVSHDTILWQHRARHAGDHPDFANVAADVTSRA